MKTCLLVLAGVALAACAAPRRDIPGNITYLPDGAAGYAITCDKPFSDEADCLTRAGRICEAFGYKIVSRSNELLSLKRDIMIRCNTESGLYPGDRP